jgi:hypothetical protein
MIPDFKTNIFSAEFGPAIRPDISIYLDHVNRRLTINCMYMFVYGQMVRWIGVFNMYLWPPAIPTQLLAILIIDGIWSIRFAETWSLYGHALQSLLLRCLNRKGSRVSRVSMVRCPTHLVPGRCHLTYLIKKDGWINEVGPGWPCILSCENRFSESWQVIPILVKIWRLWIWSESRAQLLNHIHLIWISDIWSPLSLCFLCTRHNLRSFPTQSLLCSYGLAEENGQVWPDSIV